MPLSESEVFQYVRNAHRTETAQDYVKIIAELIEKYGYARQVEIARRLGVAQPTVAKMLSRLAADGLLEPYDPQGAKLTLEGLALADFCRKRHSIVENFLRALGISEKNARLDSEGIEHHISEETLNAFAKFVEEKNATTSHCHHHQ